MVQTQQSSLAQRIQFLEAKGLTPVEIDIAIKQSIPYQAPYASVYGPAPYAVAGPLAPQWDWRDYFVRFDIGRS